MCSSRKRGSASRRQPRSSERLRRSCGSAPIAPMSSSGPSWKPLDGGKTTMTDPGMPSRFESEVDPPEELLTRIRAAVAATHASTTNTGLRIRVAMAVIPVLVAAVLLVGSHIVYERPALRVNMGTPLTAQLLIVLLLLGGLTLSATLVAVGRGEHGLGAGATALVLVALLVTPI